MKKLSLYVHPERMSFEYLICIFQSGREEARCYYNYNTSSTACYWDEESPDDNLDIACYRWDPLRETLFYLVGLLTVGISLLLCYWFSDLRVRVTARRCTPKEADCALVRNLVRSLYLQLERLSQNAIVSRTTNSSHVN